MCKNLRDIIPQKIINPTSLEDIGWNSCCQAMEENLKFCAAFLGENTGLTNKDIFSEAVTVN